MSKAKGFIVGALLGTAGALLLAPKSGRELRQDIKDVLENNDWFSFDIEYLDGENDENQVAEENNLTDEDIVIELNEDK